MIPSHLVLIWWLRVHLKTSEHRILKSSTVRRFCLLVVSQKKAYALLFFFSVHHSLMGCPYVCRKHMPTPRCFAQPQPGFSRSTPTHVQLRPSLTSWERTLTGSLWRHIRSVFSSQENCFIHAAAHAIFDKLCFDISNLKTNIYILRKWLSSWSVNIWGLLIIYTFISGLHVSAI